MESSNENQETSYTLDKDHRRRTSTLKTKTGDRVIVKRIYVGVDVIIVTESDPHNHSDERVTTTPISREKARAMFKVLFGTVSRNKREGFYAGHYQNSAARISANTVLIDSWEYPHPSSKLAKHKMVLRGQRLLTKRFNLSEKPDFQGDSIDVEVSLQDMSSVIQPPVNEGDSHGTDATSQARQD